VNLYNLHSKPETLYYYDQRYTSIGYLNSRLKVLNDLIDDWLIGDPFDDLTDDELYARICYSAQDWLDYQESEFIDALEQIKPALYMKIKKEYQLV